MRYKDETNRDTTRWKGSTGTVLPTMGSLKPQHCLLCGVQPRSDTCLNNVSVHCVRGCLLPPKRQTDLAVLHIGNCGSPTCCHTLP